MNPEQPDRHDQRKALYRAAKDVTYVLKLRPGLKALLDVLIDHIPNGAPRPVSPAAMQRLADKLGCEDRAIRYRIARLVRLGLVTNRCLANGRRHVQRARTGTIVHVAGIDLSPLLDTAWDWADRAADKKDAYARRARLRFQISEKRGALVRAFRGEEMPADLEALWSGLPRDIAKLGLAALEVLVDKVDRLISVTLADQKSFAGQPEECDRAYITDQGQSESCNPAMPAGKRAQEKPPRQTPRCGLEHVSLRQAVMAAPDDWRIEMERHGRSSWHILAGIAYQRARALGVSPSAWALAQNAVGTNGAAIIVMMADAKSHARGGPVRSVGGWVRRMAERAEKGTATLHRALFGLLHEEAVPC
ncbi:replication protein C-like [Palleronia aestuarii]|uniref:Replication protein C-like n=1 Tax=Palleronia aestuarii TaxID=568105 RepID=A0A2W7NM89_9RHOB|nr:replication initiation protein RepC [Palleronia aestuarii]PZX14306.1 replication protein C-like [Palleronia aestuarii]